MFLKKTRRNKTWDDAPVVGNNGEFYRKQGVSSSGFCYDDDDEDPTPFLVKSFSRALRASIGGVCLALMGIWLLDIQKFGPRPIVGFIAGMVFMDFVQWFLRDNT
jgi:hypothetical protein